MGKTLLVLGAGASKSIFWGFPTGFELLQQINMHLTLELKFGGSSMAMHDRHISDMVNRMNEHLEYSYEDLTEGIKRLKVSLFHHVLGAEYRHLRGQNSKPAYETSIDAIIYRCFTQDIVVQDIAKFAIAYLLKGTETAYNEHLEKEKNISDSWVQTLIGKLGSKPNDNTDQFHVVSFNYERTFQYLWHSITGCPIDQSKITFVYSHLGDYSIDDYSSNNNYREMGNGAKRLNLMRWDNEDEIKIPDQEKFTKIIFLGFGFDDLNMKKLNLSRFIAIKKVVGTTKGFKYDEIKALNERYHLNLEKGKDCCSKLIQQEF